MPGVFWMSSSRLPEVDTVVGERCGFSGGERRRTGPRRALLRRPAPALLDDALSAVDAELKAASWKQRTVPKLRPGPGPPIDLRG